MNKVLNTGYEYEFHKMPNGYFLYETIYRGRGVVNIYEAKWYINLPDWLQYAWDKGVSFK